MANPFFKLAMAAASRVIGKPGRILKLAAQSLLALRHVDPKAVSDSARLRLNELGRLLTAYARGRYTAVPTRSLLSVAAALVYFLNPLDLVPDALPALGLTDDFAILSWVYHNLSAELNSFRDWERSASPSS
jgi:uncharacterized membrane protein YkvA (DUF1232 family)